MTFFATLAIFHGKSAGWANQQPVKCGRRTDGEAFKADEDVDCGLVIDHVPVSGISRSWQSKSSRRGAMVSASTTTACFWRLKMKAASSQFLTVITKNYESMALKACSASSWVSYLVKASSSSVLLLRTAKCMKSSMWFWPFFSVIHPCQEDIFDSLCTALTTPFWGIHLFSIGYVYRWVTVSKR